MWFFKLSRWGCFLFLKKSATDFTEKFCTITPELKKYLDEFNKSSLSDVGNQIPPPTLSEIIKLDAQNYVNEEGALRAVDFVKDEFDSMIRNVI